MNKLSLSTSVRNGKRLYIIYYYNKIIILNYNIFLYIHVVHQTILIDSL